MSTRDRLALAAALAVALGCSALGPLYADLGWAAPTLAAVLVVAVAGLLTRRAGGPPGLVLVVQLAALVALTCVLYVRPALPSPSGTLAALRALLAASSADVERLAVPVPTRPSLVVLAVLAAGGITVLVDLLAVGLQRAALAGLPLLALLAVPSGVVPGGLGWLPFTLGAAGWLVLLLVEGAERTGRWGAALDDPAVGPERGPGEAGAGRVGRRIGATALGLAVVVPALVPGLDARLLPGTGDGGGGGGARTTFTYNPITRLQGQLLQPVPRELLRYTTSDPTPDYVRMTTLDVFDGTTWRSSALTGAPLEDGIPLPPGSASASTRQVRTSIRLAGYLDSQWLPAPAVPQSVEVPGRWLWDPVSQTVFATRTGTRRVSEYVVEGVHVLPRESLLDESTTVDPSVEPYTRRVRVSPEVEQRTRAVVSGAETDYDQALALQTWFQDPANGFRYDLQTAPFRGRDALGAFLEAKRGFCEQYASAMAAMLRVLGIPSRVAVGFTPGAVQPDGSRVVTTSDAHAWPEAWFQGAGWVRFEPTPTRDGRTVVPDYRDPTDDPSSAGPDATATASPQPSASASSGPNSKLEDQVDPTTGLPLDDPGSGGSALPSGRTLGAGLVVLLLATPAALAATRRRVRWRRPGAAAAWQSLREDAEDVGHRWRAADSPRAAAAGLLTAFPLYGAAADAVHRLALAAERDRYARPGAGTGAGPGAGPGADPAGGDALRTDVATVRAALRRSVSPLRRLQAVLAPPSALHWAGEGLAARGADLLDRVDALLAVLPRRLRRRSA